MLKRWLVWMRFFLGSLFVLSGFAAWADDFLPQEQAFFFSSKVLDTKTIELSWTIAPGYYLYRDRFDVVPAEASTHLLSVDIPAGKRKFDENLGKEVEILRDVVVLRAAVESADGLVGLNITSQGCADAGLCYPPLKSSGRWNLLQASEHSLIEGALGLQRKAGGEEATASHAAVNDEAGFLAQRLQSGQTLLVLLVFFGLGVLLAFTPCMLPMVPILSAVIVSNDFEASKLRAFFLALCYVAGMSVVYTVAGVFAGLSGKSLVAALQTPWILGVFAGLLCVFGVAMLGAFHFQLPAILQTRLHTHSTKLSGGRYGQVAVMGALSALLVGPCVAPPLAGALLFIGQTGNWLIGGLALFFMAWGLGFPLLVAAGTAGQLLPKTGVWMEHVKHAVGALLIALAIWTVQPLLNEVMCMTLWGTWFLFTGIAACALEGLPPYASILRRIGRGVAVLFLLIGVVELIGVASGGRDVLAPLKGLQSVSAVEKSANGESKGVSSSARSRPMPHEGLPFQRISSAEALATIASAARPVMLDFYADWCVSCKEMERFTFSDPRVQSALADTLWLQVDVTANTPEDQQLMKKFLVFGPPAIVFFDLSGKQVAGVRVVGFQGPDKFLNTLSALKH